MSLIWLAVAFAVGAVYGAKHQALTLFLYTKYKPLLDKWKAKLATLVGTLLKKKQ